MSHWRKQWLELVVWPPPTCNLNAFEILACIEQGYQDCDHSQSDFAIKMTLLHQDASKRPIRQSQSYQFYQCTRWMGPNCRLHAIGLWYCINSLNCKSAAIYIHRLYRLYTIQKFTLTTYIHSPARTTKSSNSSNNSDVVAAEQDGTAKWQPWQPHFYIQIWQQYNQLV